MSRLVQLCGVKQANIAHHKWAIFLHVTGVNAAKIPENFQINSRDCIQKAGHFYHFAYSERYIELISLGWNQ